MPSVSSHFLTQVLLVSLAAAWSKLMWTKMDGVSAVKNQSSVAPADPVDIEGPVCVMLCSRKKCEDLLPGFLFWPQRQLFAASNFPVQSSRRWHCISLHFRIYFDFDQLYASCTVHLKSQRSNIYSLFIWFPHVLRLRLDHMNHGEPHHWASGHRIVDMSGT